MSDATLHFIEFPSPVGLIRVAANVSGLRQVHLLGPAPDPAPRDSPIAHQALIAARRQLAEYFAGRRTSFDLPLAPEGTEFDQATWNALLGIPHGETISYAELARRVGRPGAARAVGRANGRNPLAIVIPCHRVIAADGSLGGYSGGLSTKRLLLDLESRQERVDASG